MIYQRFTLLLLLSLFITCAKSQFRVGSPNGSVDGSAALQISSGPYPSGSSYRGLLLPVVTTDQRGQIASPATGLLVFNTSTNQIEVNTGTSGAPTWTAVGTSSTGGNFWSLTGNNGITGSNFLGTINNAPLYFRVSNQNAGRIDQQSNNVGLGYLSYNINSTGTGNTAVGTLTLGSNTSGNYNLALGLQALQANTTGSNNTGLGTITLIKNTTGVNNTAAGSGALQNNTTGYENTAVGTNAEVSNTSGHSNIAMGTDALFLNTTGNDNTAFGGSALYANSTGNANMATGNLALRLNTTGATNSAAGTLALQNNTTGSSNSALGFNAGPSTGNLNNTTAIGANAVVGSSNQIVLGDNTITSLRCNVQTISSLSDKRIKEDVRMNVPGLRFITRLNPVTYHVNKSKEARLVGYSLSNVKEDKTLHSGFIAQDVEAAAHEVGYDFEGVRQEEHGRYYTLGYTLFVVPLVQAVKELNSEVERLKARINESEESYAGLAAQIKQMQSTLDKIQANSTNQISKK